MEGKVNLGKKEKTVINLSRETSKKFRSQKYVIIEIINNQISPILHHDVIQVYPGTMNNLCSKFSILIACSSIYIINIVTSSLLNLLNIACHAGTYALMNNYIPSSSVTFIIFCLKK